jgi:DNA-binding CsgD family transcriptional regulator/tetratricopeptide (TPR) repeat protein
MNRRFVALSPECQYLLQIAACLGRKFELSLVERISALEERELQGLLNEAIDASALQEVSPDQFAFYHPLMREVVYGAIPSANKLAIHQRIASGLEHYFQGALARHAREIAHHLISARSLADPGKVVTFCVEGARQARALFAFDETRELVHAGLGALDRLPEPLPRLRAHLLKQSGYVETIAGRPDQALAAYREALALYQALGDGEGSTDAHRWISTTLLRYGRWADALAASHEGLRQACEGRTHAYIGLIGTHALAALINGELAESGASAKKLLELSFDNETRAVAHHTAAGQHSWGTQDPSQALAHFDESRRLFLKEGRDATSAQVALDQAYAAYFMGEFARAAEAAAESERLATATGRVSVIADLLGLAGIMRTHQGAWEEASEAFERWREMRSSLGGSTIYGQLAQRAIALERLWRHGPVGVEELLAGAPQPLRNEPLEAFLLDLSGQREQAAQRVALFKHVVPADGTGLLWLSYALPLLAMCARLRDLEGARWAGAIAPYSGGVFDWFVVDTELGRMAALEKRWAQSEEYFRRAEAVCSSAGMRPFLGQAYVARGLTLLERRQGEDRRLAAHLLEDAACLFEELGLDDQLQRTRRLLARPARGRPFRRGPAELTERETTVLRLLADGCSNREIAGQLFISEKTVSRHLESVYSRLAVKNRSAAIAWYHRHAAEGEPG